jgi:putative DNA methylase
MSDFPRLIEHAFPLEATSIDSVHEKNVRHGHISTLHIWPARRPLAACRAALIATLLPDPGTAEGRRELCEKIAGKVVKKIERKKMPNGQIVERVKKETEGGILHWGRETENAETLQWFRDEIRKAYGGRAPKVLDPFSGGGAIPLEAMRLGCEATAVDINPVAWFILKCTLEYPQKLSGQTRPLPDFILGNDEFMTEFFKKAKGYSKTEIRAALTKLHERLKKRIKWNDNSLPQQTFGFVNDGAEDEGELQADISWHVRAWGQWVLQWARHDLAKYYPAYADFEPLKKDSVAYEPLPMRLLGLKDDSTPDIESLNREFSEDYLAIKGNPRWVAKQTVAYLWARAIECKNCRAEIPLLKTKWLCKKSGKRVLLEIASNDGQIVFAVRSNVPQQGGNAAQKREHDKRLGDGTMSRSGVKCPGCNTITSSDRVRVEAQAGRLNRILTCVVVDGMAGKEYRAPTDVERRIAELPASRISASFEEIPYGELNEPVPKGASRAGGGSPFTAYLYGLTEWKHLFTDRQAFALSRFVAATRAAQAEMERLQYPIDWSQGLVSYLSCIFGRLALYNSSLCRWINNLEAMAPTYARFALAMLWDYAECNVLSDLTGGYRGGIEWVANVSKHLSDAATQSPTPIVKCKSAIAQIETGFDVIITDPPYYDAIPYSDLMDFFYLWLRRITAGVAIDLETGFENPLAPKWNHENEDGELIDDSSRHQGNLKTSKQVYEDGMARAFIACFNSLNTNGRLVIVFAHKQPDAWDTLVSAIIRAGFVVDGSWPIRTEREARARAHSSAALSSSVWLVCKKRSTTAKPGWDNKVLEEMHTKISTQLREFWDAGIRGPDFVWAATGPAMEAYSKHPVVRKALVDGEVMTVSEFLTHVRRMVVDYVVGQVLTGAKEKETVAADRLDEVTAYYLLHRYDFQMEDAPIGACILYATACGLSDTELERTWDILVRGNASSDEDEVEESDPDEADPEAESSGSGSKVKLKAWDRRTHRSMGFEAPEGRPVPLVDRIHRVMHLWKSGDVQKVDEYLDEHALRRNELFKRVVQSLIELSSNGERSLLESISNHIGAKGAIADRGPLLAFEFEEDE